MCVLCVCVCMCVCVRLFATPWTVACQGPLSMGFSRQEYWRGWPFPSPRDPPDPGIKPMYLLVSWIVRQVLYQLAPPGKPHIYTYMLCLVTQSCPTLYDSVDCSPPGSSVYGDSLGKTLEWVAMPSSRKSSQPRDWTQVSRITGGFFTIWATREAQEYWSG